MSSPPITSKDRELSAKGLATWRKFEIIKGIIRGKFRGLGSLSNHPVIHKVSIRRTNGKLTVGSLSEIHDRVAIGLVGASAEEPAIIEIGARTSIWYNTVLSARKRITIGSGCAISWNCTIIDNDMHEILEIEPVDKPRALGITIGDNVWIGANCMILKGVSIGEGSVVAAGSIVTKDVPPRTLVMGSPAKPVRTIAGWR